MTGACGEESASGSGHPVVQKSLADSTRCEFEVHVTAGRKTEVAILLGGSAGAVVSDCTEIMHS